MKKIVIEDQNEGLLKLLGERVTLYCQTYIYSGILSGVNDDCVLLTNAEIVYDTGAFSEKSWSTSEKFPNDWYVSKSMIESFGVLKNAS